MDEMKPCPFCGSKKISLDVSGNWAQVECDSCGSAGAVFDNKEEAIEAWNTRA